ncbi:MAG: DUF255 domain-containing protein [Armatimonadetes bacterium]|nr:DUF255 domain-containing protein [Armatimonadota bacterium]
MPGWGAKQTYPAVVGTMVVLVGIFTTFALLRPLIPPPEPNPVASLPGGFMAQAAKERVRWRTLSDEPFAEAKRTDRPLLFVVGCDWNGAGRQFDNAVLSDTEVAERLNREFVPVRIDATVSPEWRLGPMPLAWAASGIEPGWYVLVLRPDGRPVGHFARNASRQKLDAQVFLSVLSTAQRLAGLDEASASERAMALDRSVLFGQPTSETGDLSQYAESSLSRLRARGAPSGVESLNPWEWRFLGADGLTSEEAKGVRALMVSGFVDWLDGGFFRSIETNEAPVVRFEKVATLNADTTATLAALAAQTKDPFVRKLAERGFDGCLRAFVHARSVSSAVFVEAETMGRAKRYSFKPQVLARSFSAEENVFLKAELGLDVDSNAAMVPVVKDPINFVERTAVYDGYFARLRNLRSSAGLRQGTSGLVGETATLAARLVETARLLNDRTRLGQALELFALADEFRTGPDDLLKTKDNAIIGSPCLYDYLAYADAAVQVYQATGDARTLESGTAVLKRSLRLFGRPGEPVLLSSVPERIPEEAGWATWPSVTDGAAASATGTAVRLLQTYACVYRDRPAGKAFRSQALTLVSAYGHLTRNVGFRIGCLAHAMSVVLADTSVVTTGPDAAVLAFKSAKEAPETPCVPALGTVRTDFQGKAPGVYVVRQGTVTGPFAPEEVGAALGAP